jgi:hypothetical protein
MSIPRSGRPIIVRASTRKTGRAKMTIRNPIPKLGKSDLEISLDRPRAVLGKSLSRTNPRRSEPRKEMSNQPR